MADENQKDNAIELPEGVQEAFDTAIEESDTPLDEDAIKAEAKKFNQVGNDIIGLTTGWTTVKEGDAKFIRTTGKARTISHLRLSGEPIAKFGVSNIDFVNFDPDFRYEEGAVILGEVDPVSFACGLQPNVGFKTDKCLIVDIPDTTNLYPHAEPFPQDWRIVRTYQEAHPKSIIYFFNGNGDMAKLVGMSSKLAAEQNKTLFFEASNTVYVKEPITQVDIKLAQDSLNLTKALL